MAGTVHGIANARARQNHSRCIPLSRSEYNTSDHNLIHALRTPAHNVPIRGSEICTAIHWCAWSGACSGVRSVAIDVEAILLTIVTIRGEDADLTLHGFSVLLVCVAAHRVEIPQPSAQRIRMSAPLVIFFYSPTLPAAFS
jgi:hypothetical protein